MSNENKQQIIRRNSQKVMGHGSTYFSP